MQNSKNIEKDTIKKKQCTTVDLFLKYYPKFKDFKIKNI